MPASPGCSSRIKRSSCSRGAGPSLGNAVADVGAVEAADEDRARPPEPGARRSRGAWARRRWRSARCAAPRESVRAAPTAACIRAGSRGPTGRRSGPRRWRTGRCGRAPASRGCARAAGVPGRHRADRVRRAASCCSIARASPASRTELRKRGAHARPGAAPPPGPASARSAARPRCRCPGARGRESGKQSDLPPPVGISTSASRPAISVAMTSSCGARKCSYPNRVRRICCGSASMRRHYTARYGCRVCRTKARRRQPGEDAARRRLRMPP